MQSPPRISNKPQTAPQQFSPLSPEKRNLGKPPTAESQPAKQLEPQILRKSMPTAAKPPTHSTISPSQRPMHDPEEDSLVENQIDYNNLPKTTLNPTV